MRGMQPQPDARGTTPRPIVGMFVVGMLVIVTPKGYVSEQPFGCHDYGRNR
jgi:hypothetical protein